MKFLKDVKKELSKIRWLKKQEVLQQFIIVNVISISIIIYFGLIDFLMVEIKNLF